MTRTITVLSLAASLFASSGPALAIGFCENLSETWTLEAVSADGSLVLLQGDLEWCEETDEGEERGVLHTAQVRDVSGKVSQWYLRESGKEAARRLAGVTRAVAPLPMSKLDERKKAEGFLAPKSLQKSPSGRCEASVAATKKGDALSLTLRIAVDGKEAWSAPIGDGVASEVKRQVLPLYLPTSRSVLLWATLPRCAGGPPPGYFGDDDPGECYVETELHLKLHETAGTPLVACFEPQAPAPGKGDRAPMPVPGDAPPSQ